MTSASISSANESISVDRNLNTQGEIMSAFVVDREHIRFLVEAARLPHDGRPLRWFVGDSVAELLPSDMDGASHLGQLLWSENVNSVQHRYPQDKPEELPGPCDAWPYDYGLHDVIATIPHPLAVIQACRCYAYQTCAHP